MVENSLVIVPSDSEKPYYEYIFSLYSKPGDAGVSYIPTDLITSLLKKSGLSKTILTEIWSHMPPKATQITQQQLYLLLRRVAIAQYTPLDYNIESSQKLPTFDDESLKIFKDKLEQESIYFLASKIVSADIVKSGLMGIHSYVCYIIETKVEC